MRAAYLALKICRRLVAFYIHYSDASSSFSIYYGLMPRERRVCSRTGPVGRVRPLLGSCISDPWASYGVCVVPILPTDPFFEGFCTSVLIYILYRRCARL